MERTITQQPASPSFNPAPGVASRPGGGLFGGGFGRGLLGGLAGGLLGAGLFGMLTGHGFLGGMEGFMGFVGLLLQIGLIIVLARFAYNWFAGRKAAAPVGAGARPGPTAAAFAGGPGFGFGSGPAAGAGAGFGGGAPAQPATAPLQVTPDDFAAFERLLKDSQAAFSREDMAGLNRVATPEMAGYFEVEMAHNRGKGVINRISDVKLLQGDLSEAWREGADDYATVAMRFSLIDVVEDRETGKIVSGDPARPDQSTEVWTFRRPSGAGTSAWKLSAIQQAA
jgi:predicted lipid-binding transport protein (Tim44 family)